MMNTIAIDVASEVSAICILRASGKLLKEEKVATHISALKKIIKEVPRPRQVVFEEGTQAAWLWAELYPLCDDVLVCDPRAAAGLSGQFKSDQNDARNLARRAQANLLKRVWHAGKELQSLRETVRAYQNLTEESTRLKNQIRAVFRGQGIPVSRKVYDCMQRGAIINKLKLSAHRERIQQLANVLDAVSVERAKALKVMIKCARKQPRYLSLRKIDGIGPIFSAMFLAEVGDPFRFRTRKQLWSYSGLAVMTHESSEFEVRNGHVVRKSRNVRTRGLVHSYNRTLKYVLKQAAMTLSHSRWAAQYQMLINNSKNKNNAQLTLARKLACVMLHIAKTGDKYDLAKVFKAQKV